MAHAAGRWERIQRTKELRPYLAYWPVRDARTRPEHLAWRGVVLPVDDPWWQTHYPPNGWRCRCQAIQLSERDLKRFGLKLSDGAPPLRPRKYRNPRTGEVIEVPEGIDPGFAYNVGEAHMAGLTPPPTHSATTCSAKSKPTWFTPRGAIGRCYSALFCCPRIRGPSSSRYAVSRMANCPHRRSLCPAGGFAGRW